MARGFQGGLLVVGMLAGPAVFVIGCGPGTRLVDPSRERGYWDPQATKSPPSPDGGGSEDDNPPPMTEDAGGTVTPPTDTTGPGSDGPAPRVDADTKPDATTTGPSPADAATTPPPPDMPPAALGPCMLKFDVTTVTFQGNYAPKNVGAIWVTDGNDKFVKTLRVWANQRRRHLNDWIDSSGSNTTDAITSATMSSEGARSATWDCTDVQKQPVPGGAYRINIEFTEENSAGQTQAYPFTRSAMPQSVSPPDHGNFKGAKIVLTP